MATIQTIQLPSEFVRTNWVSQSAKDKWEPIFSACTSLFVSLECAAVREGLKLATIQNVDPGHLDKYMQFWMKDGFIVVPLDKVQHSNTYQSSGGPCDTTKPWSYKVVIGKLDAVSAIVSAYEERDDETIGSLLGYPDCCSTFFRHVWVENKQIDTSLSMVLSYPGVLFGEMVQGVYTVKNWSPYCNILLRWLGLRFVSHLPCSFSCLQTNLLGEQYKKLAYASGHRTTADALEEILGWPVEWSSLHGIGLVTTPVCRVEFRTDMMKDKHVIRLESETKPTTKEAGLVFPLEKLRPIKKANANGFYNMTEENKAHNMILDLLRLTTKPMYIVDLGCGDMSLLKKVCKEFDCTGVGVDSDESKAPNIVADVFDYKKWAGQYDLALISKARIRESSVQWEKLLRHMPKVILVYSYDDDKMDFYNKGYKLQGTILDTPYLAEIYFRDEKTNTETA